MARELWCDPAIKLPDVEGPHFHAYYGEHEAAIAIRDGSVLWGSLPRRAMGHVQEWRQPLE
jgi:hypothetical protein